MGKEEITHIGVITKHNPVNNINSIYPIIITICMDAHTNKIASVLFKSEINKWILLYISNKASIIVYV
jgi:hypothetical protein